MGLINIEHWDKSNRRAELSVAVVGSIVVENLFHQKNLHQIVYKESFLAMNEDRDVVRNHCESHFYSFIHAFWCLLILLTCYGDKCY